MLNSNGFNSKLSSPIIIRTAYSIETDQRYSYPLAKGGSDIPYAFIYYGVMSLVYIV
jgi:hypothetical protein